MSKYMPILLILVCSQLLIGCATTDPNAHINAKQLASYQGNYQALANKSWPSIELKRTLVAKQKSPAIPEIRNRLIALNDLSDVHSSSNLDYYDNMLKAAVQRFQQRNGLKPDGIIGKTTMEQLNISPKERLSQLNQAIADWQALPPSNTEHEYIHVNLASYQLNVYQGDHKDLNMNVVVGSPKWPTPTLNSEVQTVVINPTWNVPKNITEKELIHKIADNQEYLQEENINVIDGWHKGAKQVDPSTIDWKSYTGDEDLPYRLVQGAGDLNALGRIKFTFPNKEHVYLHDTPNKAAFNLTKRNVSHGCIRLQQPMALLDYLFEHKLLNKREKITKTLNEGNQTRHYALDKAVPIYISRINVWVDDNGLLNFRD